MQPTSEIIAICMLTIASPNDIHYIEKLRNGFWTGVMVNPVSPNYCIPIPNFLVNAVPPYTIH